MLGRHHHRRHRDRHRRPDHRRHRRRRWRHVVVTLGDRVNADVLRMVNGQVRDPVRRKGGGAAAERGAAGARATRRRAVRWSRRPTKEKGPRRRSDATFGNDAVQFARITGMPSFTALSTRLSVMPPPGNASTPFGSRLSSSSLRRNGAARPCAVQSGLHTT